MKEERKKMNANEANTEKSIKWDGIIVKICPDYWAVELFCNTSFVRGFFLMEGTNEYVTKFSNHAANFGYQEFLDLVDEVNDYFQTRGVNFIIDPTTFPKMGKSIKELGENNI